MINRLKNFKKVYCKIIFLNKRYRDTWRAYARSRENRHFLIWLVKSPRRHLCSKWARAQNAIIIICAVGDAHTK